MNISEIRDPNEFQNLCQLLLCAEYPDTQIVNDSAGDGGLDAYVPSTRTLYAMYCPEVVPRPKDRYQEKIRADLKKAIRLRDHHGYHINEWVFLTPTPLGEELHRYIQKKARQAKFINGINQSDSHLLILLLKHPAVRTQFPRFVISDLASRLDVGFTSIENYFNRIGGEIQKSISTIPSLLSSENNANYLLSGEQVSVTSRGSAFSITDNYISPAIPDFVGRVGLLDDLATTTKRIVVVTGISGIGKSALLGQLATQKDKSAIFSYKFYAGLHSLFDLLSRLSQYLYNENRVFPQGIPPLQIWAEEIIEELNQRDCWLLFDDADHIGSDPTYLGFFTLLKERLSKGTVFFAACTKPNFLTPLDEAQQNVHIVELEGMTEEEVSEYLRMRGFSIDDEAAKKITADLAGMPSALELLSMLAASTSESQDLCSYAEKAREQTIDYLADQVFSKLPTDEREMLSIAALFTFPFSREELVGVYRRVTRRNGQQAFTQLFRQSLLRTFINDLYELQALIGTTAITYTEGDLNQHRLEAANYLSELESPELLPQLNALEMYKKVQAYDRAAEVTISLIDNGLLPYTPSLARSLVESFKQEQVSSERGYGF